MNAISKVNRRLCAMHENNNLHKQKSKHPKDQSKRHHVEDNKKTLLGNTVILSMGKMHLHNYRELRCQCKLNATQGQLDAFKHLSL